MGFFGGGLLDAIRNTLNGKITNRTLIVNLFKEQRCHGFQLVIYNCSLMNKVLRLSSVKLFIRI